MMLKNFILLSVIIGLSGAQFLQDGQCNIDETIENFDLSTLIGTWHIIQGTPGPIQSGDCSTLDITGNITSGINQLNVKIRSVNDNFLTETSGVATIENGTPRLSIELESTQPFDLHILNTDFLVSSVLAYSCENVGNTQRQVHIWQLGRDTSFPTEMITNMFNQAMQRNFGVTFDDLTVVDNSDAACHVLPVIPPGQAIVLPGQCDLSLNVTQNFNASLFEGVWHQISAYYTPNTQGQCNRAKYVLQGEVIDVANSEVVNGTLRTITGSANVSSSDGSAKLLVTLEVTPNNFVSRPLWILATDYNSYAVSYTCEDISETQKQVTSWIISRSRVLPAEARVQVDRVIDSYYDLNRRYFVDSDQSNDACFYLPDVTGEPVVFPGQCDQNVPVVRSFNAPEYLGLWYNIESYPSKNQQGTCRNARYSLADDGSVDVFNTQVVREELLTINGVAILSTDGTGKLKVSFPIPGTNQTTSTDYWVLATDYKSYALVYSCTNINDDERLVFGWKLSRTKTLPVEANDAFNDVIKDFPVINQMYFEKDSQDADACFYYPKEMPGLPVVFPGKCSDDDISVINNFNATSFTGAWYEIQAYPKEFQPGHCIKHEYALLENNLLITTSSVDNQFLIISTSDLITSGSSGKLNINTTGSNDTVISIPFWILSVDYDDYALAYSCMDLEEDKRAIYSWKLSRNQFGLSSAANSKIDSVMSNVLVLENRYYETVSQTDDACFHLPDLEPGEPIILVGQCELDIPVVNNFNLTAYLGSWRLIESYPAEQQKGTCNEAEYSAGAGNTVDVVNSQIVSNEMYSVTGIAEVESNGKLKVTFPNNPNPAYIQVIDTDYTSYSLVYSCTNLPDNKRRIFSWKLSRTRSLTETATNNINIIMSNIRVLNSKYYQKVDQSDDGCFYYPIPGPGPVRFRGQCDLNIPVVNSFEASRYLDLWHNIESYPSTFQNGTCNNAFYSAGNTNDVDVYNTQVIDRRLDTIRGTANLAGEANVGKLIVSFPIAGTNQVTATDYWILSTDYSSYALVYTCYNLDSEHRTVLSWKLSRTKSLTTAAQTAIDAVVNTIPVLDKRYYQRNGQSDEECFYFPDPEPGKVVEFPGTCDQAIEAEPRFNLSAFSGTWYEVQAYPKEQQTGQCVSHTYSEAGTDALQLISTQVLNLDLIQTNSDVRFSSAQDSSGKLNITISANGTEVVIPYWVISTDYNDYALAYSCVDIANERRRVFSWKLSRSKTLSAAADLAITSAMNNIDVLHSQYYENINQTDSACFYLPDVPLGEPVIFPGQCDPDIPVVRNFNVARYGGRWRMLETYHSDFQNGTCNDATYTLNDDGTVSALNSLVIDEELDTITGIASVNSTDGSAKLSVKFPNTSEAADYWVLDTDYDSYALVYSCKNLDNNERRVWSWKLGRTRELGSVANTNINTIISNIDVLNSRYYQVVDHSDKACFYYPVPDGKPIRFRGQCDQTIPVVNTFQAGNYLDLWHNIESYPSTFQNGTCNNAFYSAGNTNDVDVYNTQVIDRRLDTIRGTANLAGEANVGKLIVSFPIAGTNQVTATDYWILSTDYSSYALVYTCYNLDSEHRTVLSWKLSRTKSLTTAAQTAIDAVVNTIPVLDKRYYQRNGQSDEECFYFPDPEPGKVVEFPGTCDQAIEAEPRFNLSAFSGTWYEVQAYPKEQQTGQCVSHTYSEAGTDALQLISTQVLNLDLIQTNSDVRFSSAQDSSGKLNITISANGTEVVIPYWVISTDYNDYALAYSCVDIANERRRVFSWKLSRSKTLSAAADLAITSAMNNIDVLHSQYYENINQTDSACFYLPDVPLGEPVIFPGQCDPDIPVVRNFNVTRYGGRWRMLETYHSDFQNGTCNDATYTLNDDGTVSALNSLVIDEELDTITGIASVNSTDGSAKLSVKFPNTSEAADYWVLDTDYDSYALVYSCKNLDNNERRVWSWKLGRTRELGSVANTNINTIISNIDVLNSRYYQVVDHSDKACFYYPVPDGKPIRFRGQCDQTIPVVNTFQAGNYLDLWHNIESYPSTFQNGTCNNAFYSAGNTNDVDVYNTQVIDRRLDTIRGTANLAGEANVGKLIVSFPIAGTNQVTATDYWILSTDYSSYALVYTCYNLDSEHRTVLSWKLSRTKSLTTAAQTAIDAVVNTIPVLDKRYYQRNGQSDEECFYFPDPEPGKVVEFPGTCDQAIEAEPRFNLSAFSGTWYEVQAYPKEQQTGQCVSHTYSEAGTDALQLISTQVLNLDLIQTNSDVRFSSAQDSSGKLNITISANGTEVVIPYWVISTDYNDYALAYSCVDIANERRRVFSWKLSRSKTLSAAADLAITSAMNNIDVLHSQYYENINQTDSACFYLPDVPLGEPVIFPGQCDPDIPVVRNFNVARYGGRWRMLETYHSDFQNGTCNDATYTLNDDGTVSALNSLVIDEELDTITGIASVNSTDGSAKLSVKFPNTSEAADYWVLDTDYDSYALVYSCKNLDNNYRRVWSWKLSRTTELSSQAVNNIDAIIQTMDVLNSRYFMRVDHSNDACFYYPEANGQPLVFRGPCEENVPLVDNFNATSYLQTWYDIESYPTGFQFGTCPTATYSINSSAVDVYNTEVVNNRLSTINGIAVPYPDGSSRLTVSFPVPGTILTTSTPYWVLATDYSNYALVYSCVNDATGENRRVSSWKLSRTKSLSRESNTAINNVVNTVKVLREKYYKERGHSDNDCFYFPENNGGPVEMSGECLANNIAIDNFDAQAFTGPWFEISKYPSELKSGECVTNEFVSSNNGFTMKKTYVSGEELVEATGAATLSNDTMGILNVNLIDASGATYETTMYVVDVNYTDHALLYGCRDIGNGKKQVYSWKLSRSQTGLSSEAVDNINKVLADSRELWDGYYEVTDQTDKGCFHYPEYDTLPEEIVLIGRCDESIRGVPNFNASGYLGNWVEIESYPQRFQNGDCARAYYTSTDGVVVNVMNTQVIQRSLDVAYATAKVASDDGSGLLDVTFTMPVSTTSNYYVLATDYDSYALVYSCRNLENNKRQVSSWKLSRGKTLSQEAEDIMDNVISNTEGLIQRNYKSTSQTEDACFYIPEADRNTPPVFRGQCQDVKGMQGFDLDKYAGWWHEIENYPSRQTGSCISSQVVATGNSYQMIDTSVQNNTATIITSTVTASSDGVLRKTFSDGSVVEILVLSTDYETYSLLYTCENISDEFKRVWSAKLSKTRELSEDAQNAIAIYIEDNRVLEEQFYFSVDQSDSVCFYYPDVTGDQVVIPGQCDADIPVEKSFDAAQYTGTWYQVERYPQRFESGNCTGARYGLNTETGVVTVLNWQVIDGDLDTVEGTATVNSTDGSAKLIVNLPVRNTNDTNPPMVSMELYVLKTDYISYSLAYSCVNVGPYRRAIGAWKLSRTRTMAEAGSAGINAYTANREEFKEDYFVKVEQSDTCPEPNSGVFVKSSIIILILSISILNII